MYDRLPYWIDLTPRAQIALDSLSNADRNKVLRKLEKLQGGRGFSSNPNVKRLQDFPEIYVLRATLALRVILRYEEPFIEILDIVRHDRLKRMYG